MSTDSKEQISNNLQFNLRTIFVGTFIVCVLVALIVFQVQSRNTIRQLRSEIANAESRITDLKNEAELHKGQGLRTRWAETMFYHVIGNSKKYPKLFEALKNRDKQNIGFMMHSLGSDSKNLVYCRFYSMSSPGDSVSASPTSYSFLVRNVEGEAQVLDYLVGGQPRIPKDYGDGRWIFGAGKEGKDCWYVIEKASFRELSEQEVETIRAKLSSGELGSRKR